MAKLRNIWINKNKKVTISNINELEFKNDNILLEDCSEQQIENLKIDTIFISGHIDFDKNKAISTIKELTKIKIEKIEDIVFIHSKRESFGDFLYAVRVVDTKFFK